MKVPRREFPLLLDFRHTLSILKPREPMQSLHTATHCEFQIVEDIVHMSLLVKLANSNEPVVWRSSFSTTLVPNDMEERARFIENTIASISHITIAAMAKSQALSSLNAALLEAGLDEM